MLSEGVIAALKGLNYLCMAGILIGIVVFSRYLTKILKDWDDTDELHAEMAVRRQMEFAEQFKRDGGWAQGLGRRKMFKK